MKKGVFFVSFLKIMPLEKETQVEAKVGVGLEVAFPIICTIVAISAIIALKYFLKNLNETVKNILFVANIHMALVSLVTSLILFFRNDEESRSENEVNDHAIEDPGENQLDDQERNESQDMNQDGSASSI